MVQQTKRISKLENLGILNEMFTQGLEELKQVVKNTLEYLGYQILTLK